MLIASFNVNSIRARLLNLLQWIKEVQPDVILCQETKCVKEQFPFDAFSDIGYMVEVVGQKSYNGVAILSKYPLDNVVNSLPTLQTCNLELSLEARYVEAMVCCACPFKIASCYVPNGNPLNSEKYTKKVVWLDALYNYVQSVLIKNEEPFLIGGDYNIIPEEKDAMFPERWENTAVFIPEMRHWFQKFLHLGLYDTYRLHNPKQENAFSFWDYQTRAFRRNDGIRIDHLIASPLMCQRIVSSYIDTAPRALPNASDHTPVLLKLDDLHDNSATM